MKLKSSKFFFRPFRRLGNQSGQGILEYILVLVVVVGIVMGLLWQFSDAFRSWANNYFGEYLACLLETGELPTIGGAGGAASTCNQFFEPFSLANGKPLKIPGGSPQGGGGDGDGDGSGGGGGDTGSTDGNRSDKNGGGGDEGGATYAGRVPGGGAGGGRFRASGDFNSSAARSSPRVKVKREGNVYTGSTEDSMPGSIYSGQESARRIPIRNRRSLSGFQIEKEEQARTETRMTVRKESRDLGEAEKKKMLVNRSVASKDIEDPDTEMSFGYFLRILIIAAIIIALAVFIGGQLLQTGKSMD